MQDNTKEKTQEAQPSRLWRGLSWAWSLLGSWIKYTLILLVLILILLQTSVVQNWLAKETTKYLSDEWNTVVSVDSLRIKFFDNVELHGFYVEDHKGDTLIYSKTLTANANLLSLIQNSLEIESLRLQDAYVAIKREENEPNLNIQFIVDYLSNNRNTKTNRKPFYLNAKALYLRRVHFYKDDVVNGQKIDAFIDKADVTFNNWDLPNKRIEIEKIVLDNPDVLVDEKTPKPLPELPSLPEFIDTIVNIDTIKFVLAIDEVDINNGHLDFSNYKIVPERTIPMESIDVNHLDIYSLDADILNFKYSDWIFTGALEALSLTEASGFEISHLSFEDGKITPNKTQLNGLSLITPQSNLGDTLIFKYRTYRDFRDFNNNILMDIRLSENSRLLTDDIMAFAHKLESNTFFNKNRDKVLKVKGRFRGKVNNLKADDLDIRLGDGTIIKGQFSSRNLAVKQEELLNFQLDELKTSMQTLRELMPTMKLPSNFDKLGKLNFSGRFDGFFTDFVAYGLLKTELGNAEMDMRMDLKKGKELANYTGRLSLQNFDLATWADNPNFGKVTFNSQVKNGVGLTAETAYAELEATIAQFPFKNYTYENAAINGKLNKNLFDGQFNIKDDNIDFAFNGSLDFTDSIPELDFKASVNRLALKPLNLGEKDFVLAGDIDLKLKNLDFTDMEGRAEIQNFKLVQDKKDTYMIDSLSTSLSFDENHKRTFSINSDIIKGEINGIFNIETIPEVLLQFAEKNYPEYANRLNIKSKQKELQTHQFDYNIEILDSKGWNFLAHKGLDTLNNVLINGSFDGFDNTLDLEVEIPNLQFNKINLRDAALVINADNSDATIGFAVDSTVINTNTHLKPIVLLGLVERDTVDFGITYSDDNSFVANLDLNGKFFLTQDSLFQISFESNTLSNLVIGGQEWTIDQNNYLRFGKDVVDTKNFELLGGDKRIFAESFGDKGLRVSMNDFDIHFIDSIWIYEPLDFYGLFNVEINIEDLYRLQGINALYTMDSLSINGDNYGQVSVIANAESLKHQVDAKIKIDYWGQTLTAEGFYNLPSFQAQRAHRGRPDKEPNYLDFKLDVQHYPVHFLDYFIGHSISNTRGNFDIDARLYGPAKKIETSGNIRIYNASITIDYLNVTYEIDDDSAIITSTLFDATGGTITDKFGNVATVSGGITHDHLKNLGFEAWLRTNRFLGLDTKKGDNPTYYGTGIGRGNIHFSGTFKQPNIYINAVTGKDSKLTMPVNYDQDGSEVTFIRFIDKKKKKEEETKSTSLADLRGLSLSMDLSITEEAEMSLIFDEQAGDIIKGRGRGNIQMFVPRVGDLTMFGDFEIEEGEYLFTLMNFVNKPFRVRKGGTIKWIGDPFGAKINLEAEYSGLSTSLYSFIQEYLTSASTDVQEQARVATEVDLVMLLQGDLLKPIINFDISFPRVTGSLKSYAETKLRTIKQDQNELNRQVFGLIVIGQFLPSNYNFQGSEVGINTLSELIANQVSILVTEFISEYIGDNSIISSIDFDISYNYYENPDLNDPNNISSGNEFQVRLKNNFLNDKLSVIAGFNSDFGNQITPTSGALFGNDFTIEYFLNADRTLKARLYQTYQPDVIEGGNRFKFGGGVSFRREFDTFKEFAQSFLKNKKK